MRKARAFSAKPGQNKEAAGGEGGAGGATTGSDGEEEAQQQQDGGEVSNAELERLRAEVIEKTAFAKDLNDRLLRTLADMVGAVQVDPGLSALGVVSSSCS